MNRINRTDYFILPGLLVVIALGLLILIPAIANGQVVPNIAPTAYLTTVPIEVAIVPTATEVPPVAADPVAQTVSNFDPVQVEAGQSAFQSICVACHGVDARGVQSLGKDLVMGEFALTASTEEIRAVIINGRTPFDPVNTSGVAMPARGGNPMLADAEIDHIIIYLHSLQAQEMADGAVAPVQAAVVNAAPTAATSSDFVLPIAGMNLSENTAPIAVPTNVAPGTSSEFVLPIAGMNLSENTAPIVVPTNAAPPTATTTYVLPIAGMNLTENTAPVIVPTNVPNPAADGG